MRAMVALAHHYGQGPMSIAEVAKESAVPPAYLEQLIGPLRRAGLVESKRGAQGGYQLTRPPDLVRVGEVYASWKDRSRRWSASPRTRPTDLPADRRLRDPPGLARMRDAIVETIDSMTLADLITEQRPAALRRGVVAAAGSSAP